MAFIIFLYDLMVLYDSFKIYLNFATGLWQAKTQEAI